MFITNASFYKIFIFKFLFFFLDKSSDSRHQIPNKDKDHDVVSSPIENNAFKNETNKIQESQTKEAQLSLKEAQKTIQEASEERKSGLFDFLLTHCIKFFIKSFHQTVELCENSTLTLF